MINDIGHLYIRMTLILQLVLEVDNLAKHESGREGRESLHVLARLDLSLN